MPVQAKKRPLWCGIGLAITRFMSHKTNAEKDDQNVNIRTKVVIPRNSTDGFSLSLFFSKLLNLMESTLKVIVYICTVMTQVLSFGLFIMCLPHFLTGYNHIDTQAISLQKNILC